MEVSGKRAKDQQKTGDEVSGRQAGNQRKTKTESSEQPPECRVCERTGEANAATTFCVECNDHMCNNCARAHRGSRTSNLHQLLDKLQMPRIAFKTRHTCTTHPDTLIEYYCMKQDQLLCRHCITLHHQGCQGDDLIKNVCDGIEDSTEFRKMYKDLKDIEQKITKQKSNQESNLAAITINQQTTKQDINNFKKELYLFVDHLVDQMHEEMEKSVYTEKNAIATLYDECDDVETEIKDLITEIDIKIQSKDKMQLFIFMKTVQHALRMLGYKTPPVDSQNHTRTFNFVPNEQIRDMMRSVQTLGQLSVEGEVPVQSSSADPTVEALEQLPAAGPTVEASEQSPAAGPTVEASEQLPAAGPTVEASEQLPAAGPTVETSERLPAAGPTVETSEQLPVAGPTVEVSEQSPAAGPTVEVSERLPAAGPTVETSEQLPAAGIAVMQQPKYEPERILANDIGGIIAKCKSERLSCWITGIEFLDKARFVMADLLNKSVKILCLHQVEVTRKLQLHNGPWDVTKIRKKTLAVTCPEGRYIQLVSISRSGSLSLGQQIHVQGPCFGIQYTGAEQGTMVVSFVEPGKVQVIDMSGTVLKDLSSDPTRMALFRWLLPRFSCPHYVALSPDGQCVYVSDGKNHSVTGISLDGREIFTYRDEKLKSPTGLAVADDGVIYVCGYESDNIHMVSSEGKKIKIIIGDNESDQVRVPQSIMYNSVYHSLFVGMYTDVYLFTLTQ